MSVNSIDSRIKDIYRDIAQSSENKGISKYHLSTAAHAGSSLAFLTLSAFSDYGTLANLGSAALAVYEGLVACGYRSHHEDVTLQIRSIAFLGAGVPLFFTGLTMAVYGIINNETDNLVDGLNLFLAGASLTSWTTGDYLDRINLLPNQNYRGK